MELGCGSDLQRCDGAAVLRLRTVTKSGKLGRVWKNNGPGLRPAPASYALNSRERMPENWREG